MQRATRRPIEIGAVYGLLKVLEPAGQNRHGKRLFRCECQNDGNIAVVMGSQLNSGKTRSCGCLHISNHNTKHGGTAGARRSPEYIVWGTMIQRCENPRNKKYPEYGGRGIRVCDPWRKSFATFLADMGNRPTPAHQIDRIDNDSGYEPSNCRWATPRENTQHTRRTRLLEFNGESLPLIEWSRRTGIHRDSLRYRLDHGWTVEKTLTTPIQGA